MSKLKQSILGCREESGSKVSVLHIIGTFQYGGGEKLAVNLIKNLDKNKFKLAVCCLAGGGPLEKEIENQDVEIIKFKKNFFRVIYTPFRLFLIMKARNIKIVHTHLYGAAIYGRIAAILVGVPVVITGVYGLGGLKKRWLIFFDRLMNRFTDMTITDGEDVRQKCIEREKTNPQKIVFIRGGVDLDSFDPSLNMDKDTERMELCYTHDTFCIGTVCGLNEYKGINYLLEAAKEIIRTFPNVVFILIGDGPSRKELEDYATKLELEKKVIFTGHYSEARKKGMLALMDVFVQPSVHEGGIPVSLLEAMAMQKPVIATRVGAIPDVLIKNGVNGILCPPRDSKALFDAIAMLINNEQLRREIAKAGRETIIKHFSAGDMAKSIESIYDELLRKKNIR